MNTIRNFTKILFALVLTTALLGAYQASPVVQAEGEPPVPEGIISAGQYHTCALTPSGAVDCWGQNNYGQAADQPGPYTQVSAGQYHTCALTPSGAVDCWGLNNYGEAEDQPGPYIQVSAGSLHTCALKPDGGVDCWGNNLNGESESQPGPYTQVSVGWAHTCALMPSGAVDCWGSNLDDKAVDQPGPYIQVSTSMYNTCALKQDGGVDCWGANYDGQTVDQPGPYIQVIASQYHTCALKPDGGVDCWGQNNFGEAEDQTGPYTQVSAGANHTCALKPDGSVVCWGLNTAEEQPSPYAQVSAGWSFTCALTPSGAVDCWGKNDHGQAEDQPGPYNQLSTGSWHACALNLDGSVGCWGWNNYGQATTQPGPYTQVNAGWYFSCALTPSGAVDCWGYNGQGQVTGTPDYTIHFGTHSGPYTQVSAGGWLTCALKPSGAVDCWGSNSYGQINGMPDYTTHFGTHSGPYTQVSVGTYHACALTPSGAVDCWGGNDNGVVTGTPDDTIHFGTHSGPYTQVSAGTTITCALTPDGGVDCWGSNVYGQADDQTGPYTQVSAGNIHACALTPSGVVDCWGSPYYGQANDQPGPYGPYLPETVLDTIPTNPSNAGVTFAFSSDDPQATFECQLDAGGWEACSSPKDYLVMSAGEHTFQVRASHTTGYPDLSPASFTWTVAEVELASVGFVSAGINHTCALTPSGAVDCWGSNNYGQVSGTPDSNIHFGTQAGPYTQVNADAFETCALTTSGTMECWGNGAYGQTKNQPGPYIQVSTGGWHTCALKPNGGVDCWGSNSTGQVTGTPDDMIIFGTHSGPYIQVSAHRNHTCALTPSGAVDCWGSNYHGQVSGTPDDSIHSGTLPGPYIQVSAGVAHTCALTSSGAVDCWGKNFSSQATDQAGPYTQVSAGWDFTCALTASGAVDCWGSNSYGQSVDQSGPYTQVETGVYNTCALTPSGAVDCWGNKNDYGQAYDQPGPYGAFVCSANPGVANGDDSGIGSLRDAIARACPGGTVTFAGDTTIHLSSQLNLFQDVNIDGGEYNVIISGDNNGDTIGDTRLVNIPAGLTASLTHLTLEKGYVYGDAENGGAINSWGNLTVAECAFYGNTATGGSYSNGGAIYNGGSLTVTDSIFSGNTASGSSFISYTGNGGAIFSFRPLTVTNSIFTNNTAGYAGGAIAQESAAATITDSTFSGNSATYGGAIGNRSDNLTVSGNLFSTNLAINYGSYNSKGGAIHNDGTLTATNNTFFGNSSESTGGGIFNGLSKKLILTNNTLSGNTANSGGGLYQDNIVNKISEFYNNIIANSDGGNCNSALQPTYRYGNQADDTTCYGFTNSSSILLATLGNYGGSTQTIPLLPGSSAINVGNTTWCPATDQRGQPRVGTCDIGAFESQGFNLAVSTGDNQQALQGGAFANPLEVTISSASGEPVEGGLVTFTTPVDGASAVLTGSPGTIVDGKASVTATANSVLGSYTVTASATGAPSLVFSLANVLPQPALSALSPAAAVAGSGDLTLTVTGSDFVDVSVVRWNGANLATTYVSATELTATLPAANLASIQTALVTVFTPAPGGGITQALPFYITQSVVQVTGQDVASGTDPSALRGSTTAAATGEGLLAVAGYDANPGGTPSFTANGTYFDVYAAPGNTFSQVSIVACGLNASDKLFWWDPEQNKWVKASPQSYDSGCVTLIVDSSSSPSLSQLQGTFFAVGSDPNTAPAANPGGPYLAAINSAVSFDGGASSDPENNSLTYAWTFGDNSTGSGAAPTHTYTIPAIYDVCLTVNDGSLDSEPVCTLAVIYDPSGGFVTGGGWILSSEGAYIPDPSLSGKATFGFVSKYLKGASTPTGNTEFRFQAGSFAFQSTNYDWLVVSKDKVNAQFKGSGAVNGALAPNGNAYRFMLWAGDGSPDTFRIRIWWEDTDGVEHDVYDNGFNQAIGGGSIVVHAAK